MKRLIISKFPALMVIIFIGILYACTGSSNRNNYRKCEGSVWTTTYHITYNCAWNLDDSIFAVINRVDQSLSPFNSKSLISDINNGRDNRTDSLLRRIFLASQQFNRLSHGVFDPTVAPLVNLWGFGYRESDSIPSQAEIDSALTHVGIHQCSLTDDGRIVKPSPLTEFNFSAIAKGYACDLIGEMFRRNGCADYMVEIGGEMAVLGNNAHGDKWHIMIDSPIENDTTINHSSIAVIELTDAGIATSGNYRNFRRTSAGKIWHTINPATGYPAQTSTLSATVIAPDAMSADALATACMSMSADSAITMIEAIPSTSAMLVENGLSGFHIRTSADFPEIKK